MSLRDCYVSIWIAGFGWVQYTKIATVPGSDPSSVLCLDLYQMLRSMHIGIVDI